MKPLQFNSKQIRFLLKPEDWLRYNLWREVNISRKINDLAATLNDPQFAIQPPAIVNVGSGSAFHARRLEDLIVYRYLCNQLARHYRISLPDRRRITRQIGALLGSDTPLNIVRTDISNFYQSVDSSKMIERVARDGALGSREIGILRQLADSSRISGLPWGISTSAVLSEICMSDVDRVCRSLPGVYFFARYVDDIVIFGSPKPLAMLKSLKKALSSTGHNLQTHPKKTRLISHDPRERGSAASFPFLGYEFRRTAKSSRKVDTLVRIASSKIARIKSKIGISIAQFEKDGRKRDLEDRLKMITGGYKVTRKNHIKAIYAGLAFQYPHLNDNSQLDYLDRFLRRSLLACLHHRRGSPRISNFGRSDFAGFFRFSFRAAFESKFIYSFGRDRLIGISKIWRHV